MSKVKLHQNYNWMRRKYYVEKLSEKEIAELAGTNQSTINRWLVRHGLKRAR